MRSAAIILRVRQRGGTNVVLGGVVVRDGNGDPVPNASVNATWTLPSGNTQTGSSSTNDSGVAVFTTFGGSGVYTLTVNGIAAPGYVFDASNSVLTRSITAP